MVGRLFHIIYILMERESVTASELAEKLEVSVRTINRDIDKLSEARIPIFTTKGRGGGISLLPDFVLDKRVLSEEEKTSILSSMRVMEAVSYDDEQKALTRLEEFFGESAQDWIEVELDSWGQGSFDKERFKYIKDAILTHKYLNFNYMGRGAITNRTVKPCKLVFRSQSWYLYAFCELRNDFRYFKIRRMDEIKALDLRFEPVKLPDEKEENHYVQYGDTFEATVAFNKKMAYRLADELPMEEARDEGDSFVFTIPNAHRSWFFDYVFSYGEYATVLSPVEIRNEIADRIRKMYENY